MQLLVHILVDGFHHGRNCLVTRLKAFTNGRLPGTAMIDISLNKCRRIVRHRRAMGWPDRGKAPVANLGQAGEIIAHIAVWWGDDRGGPAHDVIAREDGIFFLQGVTQVIGRVARRFDGLNCPTRAGTGPAITDSLVGFEREVVAGLHTHF